MISFPRLRTPGHTNCALDRPVIYQAIFQACRANTIAAYQHITRNDFAIRLLNMDVVSAYDGLFNSSSCEYTRGDALTRQGVQRPGGPILNVTATTVTTMLVTASRCRSLLQAILLCSKVASYDRDEKILYAIVLCATTAFYA